MSVIHNGASVPSALGGVFYHLQTTLVAAQDAVPRFIVLRICSAAGEHRDDAYFVFFEWPRVERRKIAVDVLITIYIFQSHV